MIVDRRSLAVLWKRNDCGHLAVLRTSAAQRFDFAVPLSHSMKVVGSYLLKLKFAGQSENTASQIGKAWHRSLHSHPFLVNPETLSSFNKLILWVLRQSQFLSGKI